MTFTTLSKFRPGKLLIALAAGLVLAACANQMEPAKKMIGEVESAVTAAGADAQKYVPEQAAAVNQKLADLKAAFDKQDYKTVITTAPALLTEAKGLAETAAAKKKEVIETLGAQWTALATSLPATIAGIEAKVSTLVASKKLPKGVTKDGLAAAKTGLAEIKTAFDEAKVAFGSGDVQGALDKAKGVQAKIAEVSAQIGLTDVAKPTT